MALLLIAGVNPYEEVKEHLHNLVGYHKMTWSKTSHPISVYASMCTSVCVYLLGSCGYMLEQAQSLNISDCFSCLSLPLCVCACV